MVRYRREDEAIADELKATRRGVRDVQRPTGTERAQTTAAVVEIVEQMDPREPKAPTGLVITSTSSWTQTAASATLSASWDAVTLADDDEPIEVIAYGLWGRLASEPSPRQLTETEALAALHAPVTPGSQWLLSVRAQSHTRVWGPLSAEVAVTAATPDVSMPTPKAPILATTPAIITVTPDGPVSGSWPSHLMRLDVEAADAAIGPWTIVGTLTKGAGKMQFASASGVPRWVRLVPVDLLNRAGTPGAAETITTAGVDLGDLDDAVTDLIEAAETAANLATAIAEGVVKTSETDPGHAVGRLWLVLNPAGDLIGIRQSDGTSWSPYTLMADQILVPGSAGTVSIGDGAITAVKITATQELRAKILAAKLLTAEEADIPSLTTAIIQAGESGILDLVAAQTINLIAGEIAPVQAALVEQILDVADAQAGTAAALAAQQLAFSITAEFVRIGRPGSTLDIIVDDAMLAFRENEIVRAYLTAGQWHAESIVTPQIIIGSHVIEATPTGLAFRRA